MSNGNQVLSVGEAANLFLTDLPPEERGMSQPEVNNFVRWFGWDQPVAGLTAAGVANYAEQLSLSDTDYLKKLEKIKTFLSHVKKKGWSRTNLAVHLKARKGKNKLSTKPRKALAETVSLTRQGYLELEEELAALKSRSLEIIEEIRQAAADKDFRENAPLQAAREQRGRLEGQIMELEATLKAAVVIDEVDKSALRINIGDSVVLYDLASGEEVCYTLVNPREVDPTKGKISGVSPIGQAIIGRGQGDFVELTVPAGRLRYQIKKVEH